MRTARPARFFATTTTPAPASPGFTLRFAIALAAGLAAAVILAPFAAYALGAAGLRFPFPRIFDRTVMVMLLAAMLLWSRPLGFAFLIRAGFAGLRANLGRAALGLALGLGAIAILFAAAIAMRTGTSPPVAAMLAARAMQYIAPALVIAIIEEGFFRAFLLGGMLRDFGRRTALLVSSILYAIAHLVRAPAHFYLTGFHAFAGIADLAQCAAQLAHPLAAAPTLLGLTLLGLVLGRAFLFTNNVYCSIGMHAGFVLGAKTWPVIAHAAAPAPRWLAGAGPVPLIAAPAAWLIALLMLYALPRILRMRRRASVVSGDSFGG
jgi:membrane protease YdiL (CAAX protease family)